MPYLYDVFISYKRGPVNEQWLTQIFLPYFKDYLDNALPFQPQIFVDQTGLTPGVDFDNELFKNLIYSKCLVCILSPPYFRRSEWCIKEFLTMKYRQELLQLDAHTVPQTLIWPILYREISPMPELIKKMTYLDYSEFNVVGEAFFKTQKFLDFQEKLQNNINTIADIILHVPPLDASLETPEGRRKILAELNAYLAANSATEENVKQNPITW